MKDTYTFLTGCFAGLIIGLAFGWATLIQATREEQPKARNAAQAMAEWDKFEEGRK